MSGRCVGSARLMPQVEALGLARIVMLLLCHSAHIERDPCHANSKSCYQASFLQVLEQNLSTLFTVVTEVQSSCDL